VPQRFDHGEFPYAVFSVPGHLDAPRVGVGVADQILDLSALLDDPVFAQPTLNPFMAQGRTAWTATRTRVREAAEVGAGPHLVPMHDAVLHLPFDVADFVDFNSSLQHATNAGRILRPGTEPVRSNWRQMPVGYHARTGTIVVSGTPVARPNGQYLQGEATVVAPSERLDVEAEVGFVVGDGSATAPLSPAEFGDRVFGVVLVLDWSARDIQALESVPLGPFLGKSFATTMSAWVLPLEALEPARVAAPVQDPQPAEYLRIAEPWALDVRLEFALNGHVVSRPRFDTMYWTPAQQLAHLTLNGTRLRTGDLFASGTVSDADEFGSFLELSWDGERPLTLPNGEVRGYLADGDEICLTAVAHGRDGSRVHLGEARGAVSPARPM